MASTIRRKIKFLPILAITLSSLVSIEDVKAQFEFGRPLVNCEQASESSEYCRLANPKEWTDSEVREIQDLFALLKSKPIGRLLSVVNDGGYRVLRRYSMAIKWNGDGSAIPVPTTMAWVQPGSGEISIGDRFIHHKILDPINGLPRGPIVLLHELAHAFDFSLKEVSSSSDFLKLIGWSKEGESWKLARTNHSEINKIMNQVYKLIIQDNKVTEAYLLERQYGIAHGFPSAYAMTNPRECFAEILSHMLFDPNVETYLEKPILEWFRNLLREPLRRPSSVPTTCKTSDYVELPGWTPIKLWDLEYTGINLIKEENLNHGSYVVPIGIIEGGISLDALPTHVLPQKIETNLPIVGSKIGEETTHGTSVANLIFDQRLGGGAKGKLVSIADYNYDAAFGWSPQDLDFFEHQYQGTPAREKCDFKEAIETTLRARPKLLNVSQSFGSWKPTLSQIQRFPGIIVTSAGNDLPSRPVDPIKSRIRALIVSGVRSDGTRQGNGSSSVDILAPNETPSKDSADITQNRGLSFGQTSGATPLVTGVVAAALSHLPNLSLQQVEYLLKKASIMTQYGIGFLNAYRFIKVVKRVDEELSRRRLSPTEQLINQVMIQLKDNLFDFSEQAQPMFEKGQMLMQSQDCRVFQEGMRLIQKAFFLNPNNSTYQKFVKENWTPFFGSLIVRSHH